MITCLKNATKSKSQAMFEEPINGTNYQLDIIRFNEIVFPSCSHRKYQSDHSNIYNFNNVLPVLISISFTATQIGFFSFTFDQNCRPGLINHIIKITQKV